MGRNPHTWMGRLYNKAAECKCKRHDRQLKEQFVNGINEEITHEIMKELTVAEHKLISQHVDAGQLNVPPQQ